MPLPPAEGAAVAPWQAGRCFFRGPGPPRAGHAAGGSRVWAGGRRARTRPQLGTRGPKPACRSTEPAARGGPRAHLQPSRLEARASRPWNCLCERGVCPCRRMSPPPGPLSLLRALERMPGLPGFAVLLRLAPRFGRRTPQQQQCRRAARPLGRARTFSGAWVAPGQRRLRVCCCFGVWYPRLPRSGLTKV